MSIRLRVVIPMKAVIVRVKAAARVALALAVGAAVGVQPALAAVPASIVYQGTLRQSGGLVNATVPIVFKVWDAPAGGNELWTSGSVNVLIAGGLFRRQLGVDNPAQFAAINWAGITPYVEVTVNGTILTPREQLFSVPYALHAGSIPFVSPGAAAVSVTNNMAVTGNVTVTGNLTLPAGTSRIGIGVAAPTVPLDVLGTVRATTFQGDGSALTSVAGTDSTRVLKAGDTMTGQLTLQNSTLTVQGAAFSVGSTALSVSGGSVGVGVAAPTAKLDVLDSAASVETMVRTGAAAGSARLRLRNPERDFLITNDTAGDLVSLDFGGANRLQFDAANQWFNSGNLGVGTPNPTTRLTVNGTVTATAFAGDGSALTGVLGTDSNRVLRSGDTMTGQLTLQNSTLTVQGAEFSVGGDLLSVKAGWVGIGMTVPTVRLDLYEVGGPAEARIRTGSAADVARLRLSNTERDLLLTNDPTGDIASLAFGGTNKIQFDNASVLFPNGNVGIGVPNPVTKLDVNGAVTATAFSGDGSALTGVTSTDITRVLKTGDTMTGTLTMNNSRINLAGSNGFISGASSITTTGGVFGTTLSGEGSAITALNASAINAGTIADIRLPGTMTGKTFSSLVNLNGGFTSATPATITAQDAVHEGGELTLNGGANGAGPAWGAVTLDNYQGNVRFFTLATDKQLQVLGGGLAVTGVGSRSYFNGPVGIGATPPNDMLEIAGAGQGIYLNSTSSNTIRFAGVGVQAPSFLPRSAGTKLVLYPQVSATEVDYALGIEGSTQWYSVPAANSSYNHRWYGGTTSLMRLRGDGRLDLYGNEYITGLLDVGTTINAAGEIKSTGANAFRLRQANYGVILRNDNSDFYLLQTSAGDPDGSWNGYRPLSLNLASGNVTVNSLFVRQSDGFVGIGNTNPTAKLHISGTAGVDGIRFPDGSLMTSASLGSAGVITNNANTVVQADADANGSGDIIFQTGPTTRMNIKNAGYGEFINNGASSFGTSLRIFQDAIGNSDGPKLEFYKTMAASKRWSLGIANGLNVADFSINEDGGITSFGTQRLTLQAGGNVGIGSSNPGAKLEVNGLIKSLNSGAAYFQGGDDATLNDINVANTVGIRGIQNAAEGCVALGNTNPLVCGASGWIGIGATNPGAMLDVNGNLILRPANPSITSGGSYITIPNGLYVSGGTPYFQTEIQARGGVHNDTADTALTISGGGAGFGAQAGDTYFTGGGQVAIGNTSPGYKLHVSGDIYADGGWLRSSGNTGWYSESWGGGWYMTDATWIRSYNSKDVYINTFLRADGGIASGNVASDGGGTIRTTSSIRAGGDLRADGNFRVEGVMTCLQGTCPPNNVMRLTPNLHLNSPAANAVIINWDNGAAATNSQLRVGNGAGGDVMIVKASGRVGIGMDPQPSDTLFTVNGLASNTSGVWAVYSDKRLKKDIAPLDRALDTVLKLKGVSFNWKDPKKDAELGRVRGFLAQDVEKVVPEWVKTDDEGMKKLMTTGMDAVLVEAIKEQQKQIEALRAEVEALKR